MAHAHLGAEHARGNHFVALLVPHEGRVGSSRPHARAPRLSPHEDRAVEIARLDLGRGRVDERLRSVAPRRGVDGLPRLDAEARGDEGRRVLVPPRQQHHGAPRLCAGDHLRRSGIVSCRPDGLHHQVDRLERVVDAFGAVEVLTGTDDDRRSRIEGHVRTLSRNSRVGPVGVTTIGGMPWPSSRDDELFSMLDREFERQNTTIQLIASENFASPAVLTANGSVLTNKYSEGYPGKRYYGGNRVIDEVEDIAIDRVKALFGAEAANVQPHSGANANLAAYLALLQPGDTVMGLRLDQGGHLTHGSPVNVERPPLSLRLVRPHAVGRTDRPRPGP